MSNPVSLPIPILITLLGPSGVGKSYYLFSLGLALRRYLVNHPPLREQWQVQELGESYWEQLERWETQQNNQGTLEKTGREVVSPFWFDIEQTESKHRYRVFLIEMATEEMVNGVFQPAAGPFTPWSYLRQLYSTSSANTLLMFDSKAIQESRFTDAERASLKQIEGFLQTRPPVKPAMVSVCLMKAEGLEEVHERLLSKRKEMEQSLKKSGDTLLGDILDDTQYRQESVKGRFDNNAHTVEIVFLLKNYEEDRLRYYSISSVGLQLDKEIDKEIFNKSRCFVAYNLFKPILDILEVVEQHFKQAEETKNRGIRMIFKSQPPQEEYCKTLVDQIQKIQAEQARFLEGQANSLNERENKLKVAEEHNKSEASRLAEARGKIAERNAELQQVIDKKAKKYQQFEQLLMEKDKEKRKLAEGLMEELKKANSFWRPLRWIGGCLLSLFCLSAIGTYFYLADNQLEMLCVGSASQPLDCQLPNLITVPKSPVNFKLSPVISMPNWLTFEKQSLKLSDTPFSPGELRLTFSVTNDKGGGLFILDTSATLWKGRNVFGVVGMGKELRVEVWVVLYK